MIKPELAIDMTEWYEVQYSVRGRNEWSNMHDEGEGFASINDARTYLYSSPYIPADSYEYRVVRIVQHVFDVGRG